MQDIPPPPLFPTSPDPEVPCRLLVVRNAWPTGPRFPITRPSLTPSLRYDVEWMLIHWVLHSAGPSDRSVSSGDNSKGERVVGDPNSTTRRSSLVRVSSCSNEVFLLGLVGESDRIQRHVGCFLMFLFLSSEAQGVVKCGKFRGEGSRPGCFGQHRN